MKLPEYYTNIIKPEIERIGILNLLKWAIYLIEVWITSRIFGTIYDKLRFRIGDITYCFAYGTVSKCNFGVQMSFLGLLAAMYTLTMSIFSEYINLPPIMKWSEMELCALKLGLWLVTIFTLENWFKKKFMKAYSAGSKAEDRARKAMRMDKMIGVDIRRVKRMSKYILLILFFSLLFFFFEKKKDEKDIEKINK